MKSKLSLRVLKRGACIVPFLFALTACSSDSASNAPQGSSSSESDEIFITDPDRSGDLTLKIPEDFPYPDVPADNLLSHAKAELGRQLFFDTQLSITMTRSCGHCHQPALAFTDGLEVSIGIDELEIHTRNAMSLTNVAYNAGFNWANPNIIDLEGQAHGVLFNETPVELGWVDNEEEILTRLREDDLYPDMFALAFEDDGEELISVENTIKALASFQRTMISTNAPFDQFNRGDKNALNDAAKRGLELFFSEQLECFHCHGGFNLSQSVDHENQAFDQLEFHNNGLYNLDVDGDGVGDGDYPLDNTGIWEFDQKPDNMGRFRAPTLRNIALTGPYMHDGSIATLREVIEHYARGGRLIDDGPNAGDGNVSPFKSALISGFILTDQDKDDLLEFFNSLTDWEFICHPDLQDPFGVQPKHESCE